MSGQQLPPPRQHNNTHLLLDITWPLVPDPRGVRIPTLLYILSAPPPVTEVRLFRWKPLEVFFFFFPKKLRLCRQPSPSDPAAELRYLQLESRASLKRARRERKVPNVPKLIRSKSACQVRARKKGAQTDTYTDRNKKNKEQKKGEGKNGGVV